MRKGYCSSATLDPTPSNILLSVLLEGELAVVRVDSSNGACYWFTSVRTFQESGSEVHELARYSDVRNASWMFRSREKMINSMLDLNWPKTKTDNYDRVELQLSNGARSLSPVSGRLMFLSLVSFNGCVEEKRSSKSKVAPCPNGR